MPPRQFQLEVDGRQSSLSAIPRAREDLLYEFENIAAPDSCPIVSCVLTMRVLYPDNGAIMFGRARVGGCGHDGRAVQRGAVWVLRELVVGAAGAGEPRSNCDVCAGIRRLRDPDLVARARGGQAARAWLRRI